MRVLLVTVLCALLLAPGGVARAEWIVEAEGGVVWEDNLTRAARERDRRGGIALAPALTVGRYEQLTDWLSLQVTADLKGSVYPEFDGLSHFAPAATLGLRGKLGLGAYAPWARVFLTGGALDYGDEARDATLLETGVQAGKRLTERVAVHGGYAYESIDAGNDVFSGDAHTLSVRGTIGLTGALELGLGYAVRWGDLVVHRAPGGARPAHSRLVDTFDTELLALRIDATTHLFSVAVDYAVTPQASLSVGYEHSISFGPAFDYPNHAVRASFGWSF
jgi:hypothetical protein